MVFEKVVSGGQTGVDRAGLDAAIELGIPVGGWCPAGRRAEDGRVPASYPLEETDSRNYAVRTRYNVRDSDATLFVSELPLSGGTALTMTIAASMQKPVFVADLKDPEKAVNGFAEWAKDNRIRVLNVAGPRGSAEPTLYERSRSLIEQLLRTIS